MSYQAYRLKLELYSWSAAIHVFLFFAICEACRLNKYYNLNTTDSGTGT